MPLYTWQGITLTGNRQRGSLNAETPEQLKEQLLSSGIALLSYSEQTSRWQWIKSRNISSQTELITFFEYLQHLLNSGVPLLKALELVSNQLNNHQLNMTLKQITVRVTKGESFAETLHLYPETFSPLMVQLITAGEKTGKLPTALIYLSAYLKEQTKFKKTLTQAALFPLFTIAFAFIITLGILLFIIPQFEQFFSSLDKTLPPLTQALLTMSSWLRSWHSIATAIGVGGIMVLAKIFTPKDIFARFFAQLPFIGNLIMLTNLITTLRMLSLFLKAGIPLKNALETIESSLKNQFFKQKLISITKALVAGQSLATQMPMLAPTRDREVLRTFVTLGEQTGKLDAMLDKAIVIFEEKLTKQMEHFSLFFQPTLMIIVGLIIAFIMAAVYLPLFNLAYSIS